MFVLYFHLDHASDEQGFLQTWSEQLCMQTSCNNILCGDYDVCQFKNKLKQFTSGQMQNKKLSQ